MLLALQVAVLPAEEVRPLEVTVTEGSVIAAAMLPDLGLGLMRVRVTDPQGRTKAYDALPGDLVIWDLPPDAVSGMWTCEAEIVVEAENDGKFDIDGETPRRMIRNVSYFDVRDGRIVVPKPRQGDEVRAAAGGEDA